MSNASFQDLKSKLNSEFNNREEKTVEDRLSETSKFRRNDEDNGFSVFQKSKPNVEGLGLAKHKFEVPYNGDKNLIQRLNENDIFKEFVKFIYLPCNVEHGIVTSPGDRKNDISVEETESIIKLIQDNGFEPGILIQRGEYLEGMEWYVDRGVKYFTIGDDNLARKARDEWGNDVYLTASVTALRSFNDYFHVEPGLYDILILYFWFNRNIEFVKALPKWNKYGIMVNNLCLWKCPRALHHWFPDTYNGFSNERFNCTETRFSRNGGMVMENTALIRPSDLHYFEDYLESYKLVDRMFETEHIINDLNNYIYQRDLDYQHFKDPSLGEKNYQIEEFAPTYTVDKIKQSERDMAGLNDQEEQISS